MIYTSNYFKAIQFIKEGKFSIEDLRQISNSKPKDFPDIKTIHELVPDWNLVSKFKSGLIDANLYHYWYERANLVYVKDLIERLDGKVLLCYCGAGKFCHRHLVSDKIRKLGFECREI